MVLLTITPAAKAALDRYSRLRQDEAGDGITSEQRINKLSDAEIGSLIEHQDLIKVSKYLVQNSSSNTKEWRLETLLKGSSVYHPPPPPKPEPSSQYKALMQKLREQEEQRQYERMLNPPTQLETFSQRFPHATNSFGPAGSYAADEVDEVTYADVNRQMILIINVLISIICTSVAVWMAARRWNVVWRLLLALTSSTIVAVAEVAIYMGYIRRIKDAKVKERKLVEKKEIVDTWVIDGKSTSTNQASGNEAVRNRKGKHR